MRKGTRSGEAAGASGWIDDAALRIIDAARLDRAEVVGMAHSRRQNEFSYGGENGFDVSSAPGWQDGVIKGFAERRYSGGGTFRFDRRGADDR